MGENLVKNSHIAIFNLAADMKIGNNQKLLEPLFGEYQVAFLDGEQKEMAESGGLLKYWDVSTASEKRHSKKYNRPLY